MATTKRHPFRTLFAFCFLLLTAFGVIGYAAGWIDFRHEEQKTTIEIKTTEIKESAEQAVETTKNLIEESGDKVEEMTTDPAKDGAGTEDGETDAAASDAVEVRRDTPSSPDSER